MKFEQMSGLFNSLSGSHASVGSRIRHICSSPLFMSPFLFVMENENSLLKPKPKPIQLIAIVLTYSDLVCKSSNKYICIVDKCWIKKLIKQ